MDAVFKVSDVAFFLAVAFVSVAALVTAVRCNAKKGNMVGAWVLFVGCAVGALASSGYLVFALLPGEVLYQSGPELSFGILVVLAVVNLASTLFMAVGTALFRPFDAASPNEGSGT